MSFQLEYNCPDCEHKNVITAVIEPHHIRPRPESYWYHIEKMVDLGYEAGHLCSHFVQFIVDSIKAKTPTKYTAKGTAFQSIDDRLNDLSIHLRKQGDSKAGAICDYAVVELGTLRDELQELNNQTTKEGEQ